MAKTDYTNFSQQIATAEVNIKALLSELERTKTLLEIASTSHYIETTLAHSVRDAALQSLLDTLRPQVIVETDAKFPLED